MEIRQLRAFACIAETRTFTAAAERLHVTQAAVSMQIKQLETEVGVPLFLRTPRRVVLTEAGERLLDRAQSILREHDAALAWRAGGASAGGCVWARASAMARRPEARILGRLRGVPAGRDHGRPGTSERSSADSRRRPGVAFVSLPVEARKTSRRRF